MSVSIRYQGVSRSYGANLALAPVDLEIKAGEFVAFVGPSGCGKTTLLRLTADLDQPTTGQIVVAGTTPKDARDNRMFGLVSQRPAVLPWKTALEDVRFTQAIAHRKGFDAEALLEKFGLTAHKHKRPSQLSGGMLQRVNFASALAHDPPVLLMDEPFSALDEMKREEIGTWLSQQLADRPKTVLFVTHHVDEAVILADRVLVFKGTPGRIVADVRIDAPRPRGGSFRSSSEFVKSTSKIREILFGSEK